MPRDSLVKMSSVDPGQTNPNSDGPSITPAIISPTTCGCPMRFAAIPTKRQTIRMIAICKKNEAESACMCGRESMFGGR